MLPETPTAKSPALFFKPGHDMTDLILTETRDRIARIEINRPDKKNALTVAMYRAMADAVAAAEADPQVRVILIHGRADCFCAGNDLKDFLEQPPHGEGAPVSQFLQRIAVAKKPLIAAVGGPAVGIGTTMLLHCDLVYAAPETRFQLPFVTLGLVPEAASSYLLPKIAGYHRAAELLLLGKPFTAQAALAAGIVTEIIAARVGAGDQGADEETPCGRGGRAHGRRGKTIPGAPRLARSEGSDERLLRETQAGFLEILEDRGRGTRE
jgi:enoyl-CoA hydratase/carnithine racemase